MAVDASRLPPGGLRSNVSPASTTLPGPVSRPPPTPRDPAPSTLPAGPTGRLGTPAPGKARALTRPSMPLSRIGLQVPAGPGGNPPDCLAVLPVLPKSWDQQWKEWKLQGFRLLLSAAGCPGGGGAWGVGVGARRGGAGVGPRGVCGGGGGGVGGGGEGGALAKDSGPRRERRGSQAGPPPPGAGAEGEPGRRSARRSKHGDPGVRAGVGAGVAGPRACRKGNNKEEGKSLLHPVFPGGLPSKSSPGPTPA